MKTTPRELSKEDIGWLAGIIDGECSIVYGQLNPPIKNPKRNICRIYWGLHLVNTNMEMIEKFQKIVDILGYPRTEKRKLRILKKNYRNKYGIITKDGFSLILPTKQCYEITVRDQSVLVPVLESVLPYLTEKRIRAKALTNYLKNHKKWQKHSQEAVDKLVETKRVTPQNEDEAIVRTT